MPARRAPRLDEQSTAPDVVHDRPAHLPHREGGRLGHERLIDVQSIPLHCRRRPIIDSADDRAEPLPIRRDGPRVGLRRREVTAPCPTTLRLRLGDLLVDEPVRTVHEPPRKIGLRPVDPRRAGQFLTLRWTHSPRPEIAQAHDQAHGERIQPATHGLSPGVDPAACPTRDIFMLASSRHLAPSGPRGMISSPGALAVRGHRPG